MIAICPSCGDHTDVGNISRYSKWHCLRCKALELVIIRKRKWWFKPPEPRDPKLARNHTYNSLLYFAREKHYKDGWAAWKFHVLYGDWPNDDDRYVLEVERPLRSELLMWITRNQAKRAAERRKERAADRVRRA